MAIFQELPKRCEAYRVESLVQAVDLFLEEFQDTPDGRKPVGSREDDDHVLNVDVIRNGVSFTESFRVGDYFRRDVDLWGWRWIIEPAARFESGWAET